MLSLKQLKQLRVLVAVAMRTANVPEAKAELAELKKLDITLEDEMRYFEQEPIHSPKPGFEDHIGCEIRGYGDDEQPHYFTNIRRDVRLFEESGSD